jgi:hypothetical protein
LDGVQWRASSRIHEESVQGASLLSPVLVGWGRFAKGLSEYWLVGCTPKSASGGLVRIDLAPRRGFPHPLRSTFAVFHDLGGLPLSRLPGMFHPVTLMGFVCRHTGLADQPRVTETRRPTCPGVPSRNPSFLSRLKSPKRLCVQGAPSKLGNDKGRDRLESALVREPGPAPENFFPDMTGVVSRRCGDIGPPPDRSLVVDRCHQKHLFFELPSTYPAPESTGLVWAVRAIDVSVGAEPCFSPTSIVQKNSRGGRSTRISYEDSLFRCQ